MNGALIQKIPRIKRPVSEEHKNGCIQLIASGLRHHADLRPSSFPIFGSVSSRQHIELADSIDAKQTTADTAGSDSQLAGSRVFDAVQQNEIVPRPAPRNRKGVSATGRR